MGNNRQKGLIVGGAKGLNKCTPEFVFSKSEGVREEEMVVCGCRRLQTKKGDGSKLGPAVNCLLWQLSPIYSLRQECGFLHLS